MSGAAQILDASWDRFLAVEPLFATAVGDARFDALLPDPSEAGRAERHRVHTGLLEAAAGIDPRALTRGAADLRAGRGPDAPGAGLVDPPPGPVVGGGAHADRPPPRAGLLLGVVAFQQPAATAAQRAASPRRLAAFPPDLQAVAANAADGLASGVVASRAVVTRTIGQVERLLATPVARQPRTCAAAVGSDQERSRGAEVLGELVYKAYARSLEGCGTTCRGRNRRSGCSPWLAGRSATAARSRGWTTLPLEPDVAHRLGRAQLHQVQEQPMGLARRLGTPTRPRRPPPTRTGRPAGRLDSREAILACARDQVARSWAALPGWFGRLPGNCEVTPVDWPIRRPWRLLLP